MLLRIRYCSPFFYSTVKKHSISKLIDYVISSMQSLYHLKHYNTFVRVEGLRCSFFIHYWVWKRSDSTLCIKTKFIDKLEMFGLYSLRVKHKSTQRYKKGGVTRRTQFYDWWTYLLTQSTCAVDISCTWTSGWHISCNMPLSPPIPHSIDNPV